MDIKKYKFSSLVRESEYFREKNILSSIYNIHLLRTSRLFIRINSSICLDYIGDFIKDSPPPSRLIKNQRIHGRILRGDAQSRSTSSVNFAGSWTIDLPPGLFLRVRPLSAPILISVACPRIYQRFKGRFWPTADLLRCRFGPAKIARLSDLRFGRRTLRGHATAILNARTRH